MNDIRRICKELLDEFFLLFRYFSPQKMPMCPLFPYSVILTMPLIILHTIIYCASEISEIFALRKRNKSTDDDYKYRLFSLDLDKDL